MLCPGRGIQCPSLFFPTRNYIRIMDKLIAILTMIAGLLKGYFEGWDRERFWQVVEVTVPAGASGVVTPVDNIQTNTGYSRMLGLYVPAADSYDPAVSMEVKNSSRVIHEAVRLKHFVCSSQVEPERRLIRVPSRAGGELLKLSFTNLSTLADDVTFTVAILLEK